MASFDQPFDSSQHDDMGNFDPVPAGEYVCIVKDSDIKMNLKKNGKYLKLQFEIMKGEFKGRFIWANYNILNPNPVTVEIAQKAIATICRAVGVGVLKDTQQLHGKPFLMKVKIKPAKGDYPAGNDPTGFAPLSQGGEASEDEAFGDEGTDTNKMAEETQRETTGDDSGDDKDPWGDD